jgi:hypothetical protein
LIGVSGCKTNNSTSTSPPVRSGNWTLELPGNASFGPAISAHIKDKDYLFAGVNGDETGILVLNLQQPENPEQLAFIKADDNGMNIKSLFLSGTFLYVCASDSLWIIDVSDPAIPNEISRFSVIHALSVAISGKYAYVDDNGDKITIVDISNPSDPQVVGDFKLPVQDPIQMVRSHGSLLFALEFNPNAAIPNKNGLFIIDISAPLLPKQMSYFRDMAAPSIGYVPVPSGSPQQTYEVASVFSDIAVLGNYAYMAASGPDGMQVLDISNPLKPKMIANVPKSDSNRIILNEHYAYLIDGGVCSIIDISDPNNPKFLSLWSPLPGYGISDFAIANNHIYFVMDGSRHTIEIFESFP